MKKIYKKNSPPVPHLLQVQQAPVLPYAKVVGRPGTGSYPAPSPDPTTHKHGCKKKKNNNSPDKPYLILSIFHKRYLLGINNSIQVAFVYLTRIFLQFTYKFLLKHITSKPVKHRLNSDLQLESRKINTCAGTANSLIDLQKLVPLLKFGCRHPKWGYPPYSHRHAMAGLIRTFLTDREILNELAIHLI